MSLVYHFVTQKTRVVIWQGVEVDLCLWKLKKTTPTRVTCHAPGLCRSCRKMKFILYFSCKSLKLEESGWIPIKKWSRSIVFLLVAVAICRLIKIRATGARFALVAFYKLCGIAPSNVLSNNQCFWRCAILVRCPCRTHSFSSPEPSLVSIQSLGDVGRVSRKKCC